MGATMTVLRMLVQFVRRRDHAWPRLLDFTTERGIESNEIDLAATDYRFGHFHSRDQTSWPSIRRGLHRRRESASPRGIRPAAARTANRPDDQPARLGVEFHFLRQIRLVEQRLRDPGFPGSCRFERYAFSRPR
jgi:hypothetical protein